MLKYAADYLDLSDEDMMYVPVDDFDDGVEGINNPPPPLFTEVKWN